MKTLIIIIITTVFSFNLHAQKDFRKGYVITNEGDTTYGYIEYRGNKANADKCLFKPDLKADIITFTPNDITAYRFIDSKYYVSKNIPEYKTSEKLFLEYLIDGAVDIYFFYDEMGIHYFIDKGDGQFVMLKSEQVTIESNNQTYINQSKTYVGVLKYLLADAPSISSEINKASLNHESLINIAEDYHNAVCSDGNCVVYAKKIPKSAIYYGLSLGTQMNNFTSNSNFSDEMSYLRDNNYPNSWSPAIGLFLKVGIPNVNEKLFFQYDISYSQRDFSLHRVDDSYGYQLALYENLDLNQKCLNQTFMFKYEQQSGKIRPLLQLGAFVDYFLSSDFKCERWLEGQNGSAYPFETVTDSPFNNYEYGICLGTGLNFTVGQRLFLFDVKYQYGIGQLEGFVSNNLLFNLGIPFNKQK